MLEDLSSLSLQHDHSGDPDPELVNRIFRSAHSLKGLAGMFGADAIGRVAHHLEDILGGMRLGKIALDSRAAFLLDEGVAVLGVLIGQIEDSSGTQPDGNETAEAFIAELDAALAGDSTASDADILESLDLPTDLLRALTEYEEHRLREGMRRGREISIVDASFEIMSFEEGLSSLTEALRAAGEVISTLPTPGDSPNDEICFSLLVASEIASEELVTALSRFGASLRPVYSGIGSSTIRLGAHAPAAGGESAWQSTAEATPHSERESLRSVSQTVRVDIRKLDELMNLVGELGIQRNTLGDLVSRLMSSPETARLGAEIGKTHSVLDRKLRELQTGVLDVRMVPLRQMFDKLERVAQRLRRDLDKSVALEFVGSETELDKLIVERLVDPLVHLIRNAFDHAIESAEERRAAGKPVEGNVSVRAMQRGNRVVVEIEDDGRGMPVDAILREATHRGWVGEADSLTRREILNFVFAPGFSTTAEVNETSGRGVGMDVVRSNLADMGGSVEISTLEGAGTTVVIDLPITLAIMQALLVEAAGQRFAVPLGSVLETMAIDASEIGRSEGREILNLRGEPLLLLRLGEEFGLRSPVSETRHFVVVVGLGDQRLGIVVDQLAGQRDAMIKPIKGPLRQVRGIAGATELGDQHAILVIDVSAIMADSGRRREAA